MSAAPRVLVISPDFPPAHGGIQILTHRVVASWERVQPLVVTLDHDAAAEADARESFQVIRIPVAKVRAATISRLNVACVAAGLKHRPELVLSSHIVLSPAAAALARALRVPYVQYVHAKEIGAKAGLARFALARADRVIAVSEYTSGLARAAGASWARIVKISPGVDMPAEDVSRQAEPPAGPPTILTVARLEDRYKGHDVVLRAMPLIRAQIPDARWVVIGDGPLRPDLEQRASALGISQACLFLGAADDATRDEWLRRATVFCMVSRLPAGGYAGEGFGIVYLEAAASGIPVVAGRAGGAVDAVADGETGLLVDPEDHVAVAFGLLEVLMRPDWARELGEAGRRRAREFAWPFVSRRVEDLVLELL